MKEKLNVRREQKRTDLTGPLDRQDVIVVSSNLL
jgi:hypothetical protein